jgi:conjugative relaxase-like TrwC/TraI family protein
MLTAKNRNAHEAADYYTQRLDGASLTVRWFGKGASSLGLSGEIRDKEVFANICNGRTPDGKTKLGRNIKRAALDLTFSVPKSVSLSALIGGDDRLIEAHRRAVEQTLEVIEKHHAQTRIRAKGTRYAVNTNNLIVAQFDHFESRELDAHLHTHALVMNLTQAQFGQWYSLNNGEIYKDKKVLGMFYHVCLKEEIQKLGYEIEERPCESFEIKGYSKEDLMHFSKRRQQILEETGHGASWKMREEAWEITRKAKQHLALDELKRRWEVQAQRLGMVPIVPKVLLQSCQIDIDERVATVSNESNQGEQQQEKIRIKSKL